MAFEFRLPDIGEGVVEGEVVKWFVKAGDPVSEDQPMVEVMTACKAGGVWPFAHFNRLQVTPPCTTTADEAREGLAAIDKALEVADKHCED